MTARVVTAPHTLQQLGRYEILAELGQGAMGVVYKARDPVLDRIVAIKTINLTLPKDELAEYEARFYQEARAAGGLSHPNIVTIYDIGKSERMAYMAMEFLEGDELRSVLAAREPLPVVLALDIAAQVADGLAYAHERHVVHRDIKPTNIMVVRGSLVKITDFGIARMRTNEVKTMTGMILGSPKYMSPEQVAGKRADHRSDLFSLGVVLYEMLTGEAPFVADSIHGIMYQIMQHTPPAPSTKNADVPEILDLIVAKALNKDAEERYQSGDDLARDLRATLDMVQGRSSGPGGIHGGHGTPISPTYSRSRDRLQAVKPTAAAQGGPPSERALSLSKSFDSYEATMRLAAMTGVEQELERFSETQRMRAAAPAVAPAGATETDTWREVGPANSPPASWSRRRRPCCCSDRRRSSRWAARHASGPAGLLQRFFHPRHADRFDALDRGLREIGARHDRARVAQLGCLAQPLLAALDRAHFAREPDFAEHHQLGRQRPVAQRRDDRQHDRQIGGRLVDLHAADRIDEHILIECRYAGVTVQHREQQREPVLLQAHGQAPRIGRVRLVHQRLDLHQQRARALLGDQHAGAGHVGRVLRQE
jgi:serine/threonine-protein kinase